MGPDPPPDDSDLVDDVEGDGDAEPELRALTVDTDDKPRLDAFIAERDATLSRAQAQRLIDDGDVTVNGAAAAKPGQRLRRGDRIELTIHPPVAIDLTPEPMDLVILHEDAHLIVID